MSEVEHVWLSLPPLNLVCLWKFKAVELMGFVGLASLWAVKGETARWPLLFWVLVSAALSGAQNGFTLVSFWMLHSAATVVLFRWSSEGTGRGLYTFAVGSALFDVILLVGYLFYSDFFQDDFLPTQAQFLKASEDLTRLPAKSFHMAALTAACARVALGAGCLYLPGETRLSAKEFLARRCMALVLPALLLVDRLSFLRSEVPATFCLFVAAVSSLALFGGMAHSLGKEISPLWNPAYWFQILVERPTRTFITFMDRRIEARTIDVLFTVPARLTRAGGVWISLLQSGSLASYLTLSLLGVVGALFWLLWWKG